MNRPARAHLRPSIAFMLLLSGPAVPAAWAGPPTLTIHDLGTFHGAPTFGNAINDRGQIVGTAFADGGLRSFLWESGAMTDIGSSIAVDINNRGQILLQSILPTPFDSNSCYLRDGQNLILLETPGGSQCNLADINDRGQVVGEATVREGLFYVTRSYLWDSGTRTDLGSLGGDYTIVNAINDRGQAVGGSTPAQFGPTHAFLWEGGKMTDLAPPGASWSVAYAINHRGQVVVQAGSHLYLWEAGSMTDLGTMGGSDSDPLQISYPLGITEQGRILVAVFDPPARVFRFGVWAEGTVVPLPTLGSGLPSATRMNTRGQVVGTDGLDATGILHLVVWTPNSAGFRN